MNYIDVTPTRREYLLLLAVVRDHSTKPADRKWAREEIERVNRGIVHHPSWDDNA